MSDLSDRAVEELEAQARGKGDEVVGLKRSALAALLREIRQARDEASIRVEASIGPPMGFATPYEWWLARRTPTGFVFRLQQDASLPATSPWETEAASLDEAMRRLGALREEETGKRPVRVRIKQ